MDLFHKFPSKAENVLQFEEILYPLIFSFLKNEKFLIEQRETVSLGFVNFFSLSMKCPSDLFISFFSDFVAEYLSSGFQNVILIF